MGMNQLSIRWKQTNYSIFNTPLTQEPLVTQGRLDPTLLLKEWRLNSSDNI